jgi:O-antigen ligase
MSSISRRLVSQPPDVRKVAQWFIIAALLLVAALVARRPTYLLMVVPIVAVAVWLMLRYPGLGPVVIVGTMMIVNYSIGTGTQTRLHLTVVLLPMFAFAWMARMLYQRKFQLVPSPANLPMFGLVVSALISFIAGNLPWLVFGQTAPIRSQLGAVGVFVVSALAFFLVANEVRSEKWLKTMVWAFLIISGFFIANKLDPRLTTQWLPISFPDGSQIYMWIVILSGSQLLFNKKMSWLGRLYCLGLLVVTLGYSLSSEARDWASGWIPSVVGLALLIWLRWPKLGTFVGVIMVAVALLNFPAVEALVLSPSNEYSLLTRQAAWQIILEIIKANPLLGVGPANYYWYTTLYPILGWYVQFNSHNQYIDILAQTGLIGMTCVVWFAAALGLQSWKLRSRFQGDFAGAYVNAALAGIAGSMVAGMLGDWLLPFVYNVGIAGLRSSLLLWLFLGGVVALSRMGTSPAPAE